MHRTIPALLALVVCTLGPLAVACGPRPTSGPPAPDGGTADASTPTLDGGPIADECPAPTAGPTMHSGEVAENEVWTADGSPHIVEYDVNVRDGHTLTIEPCARVQLAKDRGINVATPLTPNLGTLIAEGTATKPIRFERLGADAWGSLYVVAPGTARLAYVELSGGGFSGGSTSGTYGATIAMIGDTVLPADPVLFLDHVTIKESRGTGLSVRSGATFIAGSRELTVTGSGNGDGDASPFPAQIDEHSMDLFPTGHYTGNKVDEILLTTTGVGIAGVGLTVDATLHDRGVPYRVGNGPNDSFYLGGKDNAPLATMTIEPGVTMRFAPGAFFLVEKFTGDFAAQAAVRAIGTAEKPIVFTSASPTPAAGDWGGLWFGGAPSAQNKLDHVRIEYAGGECLCSLATCSNINDSEGAVILTHQPAGAFITNTAFKASAQHGVMEGFDGTFIDFTSTNTFEDIAGCAQTLPRFLPPQSCGNPAPSCR